MADIIAERTLHDEQTGNPVTVRVFRPVRRAGCIAYSGEADCLIAYTVCFDQVTGY